MRLFHITHNRNAETILKKGFRKPIEYSPKNIFSKPFWARWLYSWMKDQPSMSASEEEPTSVMVSTKPATRIYQDGNQTLLVINIPESALVELEDFELFQPNEKMRQFMAPATLLDSYGLPTVEDDYREPGLRCRDGTLSGCTRDDRVPSFLREKRDLLEDEVVVTPEQMNGLRVLLRKRFPFSESTDEEFDDHSFIRDWSQRIQRGFEKMFPEGTDEDFATFAKLVEKDWKEEDALYKATHRECGQCGEWLSICIWGYPVFENLPSRRLIMGCVRGSGDEKKNWWCDQCECFFE